MNVDNARIVGEPQGTDAPVELLVATRDSERLPGMVAAVSVDGRLTTISIGHSDLDGTAPIEPSEVLRLSSMMKPLTAVAVMKLIEGGQLDLDEPASRHLCSITIDERVTIRHLLTHSSGLTRPGYFHVGEGEPIPTLRDFYAEGRLECTFIPGSAKEYSNHGYAVLGQLVEDIAGVPYGDYMRRQIFAPLHLEIDLDESKERSHGHQYDEHVLSAVPHYLPVLTPASGGWAPVTELAKFAAAMAAGGHGVLSATSTACLGENISPDGLPPRGFGWVRDETESGIVLSHAGGWPGYSGSVAFCRDAGVAVAVMINMSAEARGELGLRMIEALVA